MKIEIYTGAYGIWKGHIRLCTVFVKNQKEKKTEHEMETGACSAYTL